MTADDAVMRWFDVATAPLDYISKRRASVPTRVIFGALGFAWFVLLLPISGIVCFAVMFWILWEELSRGSK